MSSYSQETGSCWQPPGKLNVGGAKRGESGGMERCACLAVMAYKFSVTWKQGTLLSQQSSAKQMQPLHCYQHPAFGVNVPGPRMERDVPSDCMSGAES